jgi:hypothetical protein
MKVKASSNSKSSLATTKAPKVTLGSSSPSPLAPLASKKSYKKADQQVDFGTASFGDTGMAELK